MRDEVAPSDAADVASILRQMADSLEAWSYWRLPKAESHLHLRHACFVRELARRKRFCRELGGIAISRAMQPEQIRSEFSALFRKYPFPAKSPYQPDHWTAILAAARFGDLDAIPNFRGGRMEAMMLRQFEVQFAYRQPFGMRGLTSEQMRQLPIVGAVDVSIFNDATRKSARDELVRACRRAFANFHQRVKRLINTSTLGGFTVRLLRRGWEPPYEAGPYSLDSVLAGPAHASTDSVVTSFSVSMRGIDLAAALEEVVEGLLDGLETIVPFSPEVGRRPKTTLDARKRAVYAPAKWWAMRVFEGLTVEEIALKELGVDSRDDLLAEDRRDDYDKFTDLKAQISKALKRLGVEPLTK